MGWAGRTRHLKQPFTLWESNHSGKWFQRRTSSVEPLKWRGTSSVARCHVTSSAWTRTTWTTNDHDLGLSPSRHGNEMCLQKRGKMLGDGRWVFKVFQPVHGFRWSPGVYIIFFRLVSFSQQDACHAVQDLMTQYIEFVADRLLCALGHSKIWNSSNPFDWHLSHERSCVYEWQIMETWWLFQWLIGWLFH